jgi:hypothetical protein
MEPDWMKSIPDWQVCDWFYLIFIINAVVSTSLILVALWMLFTTPGSKLILGGRLFLYLFSAIFGVTTALFYYLLCDRSLHPK